MTPSTSFRPVSPDSWKTNPSDDQETIAFLSDPRILTVISVVDSVAHSLGLGHFDGRSHHQNHSLDERGDLRPMRRRRRYAV